MYHHLLFAGSKKKCSPVLRIVHTRRFVKLSPPQRIKPLFSKTAFYKSWTYFLNEGARKSSVNTFIIHELLPKKSTSFRDLLSLFLPVCCKIKPWVSYRKTSWACEGTCVLRGLFPDTTIKKRASSWTSRLERRVGTQTWTAGLSRAEQGVAPPPHPRGGLQGKKQLHHHRYRHTNTNLSLLIFCHLLRR